VNHWIVAPVVLPALAGVAILLGARHSLRRQRILGTVATTSLLGVAVFLMSQAYDGTVQAYALGAWPAPFGIVLVLDRLSAMMVLMTALVAFCSQLYAIAGADARGANYHALFQFQLMGLCGAFLTGDIFNLFVFFEVLLIASYGLLLHGGGRDRVRAGLHYVIFNLVGSALFLIGVGTIYGITGTLNMADLAVKVGQVPESEAVLLMSGALVLLVVFAIKAALLPLCFWLPLTYGSASAPVAALFAIMTKVGVYAIVRVYSMIFGSEAGFVANLAGPWLLPLALSTLVVGALGAVAGRRLRSMVAYLVIASVGTMLTAVALGNEASLSAAFYYMAQSTFVLAALFLLIELIARQRGDETDQLESTRAVRQPALLGGLFLLAAVAIAGLPPLSGFVGKVLVLRSALTSESASWVYAVILVTSLLILIAVSRAGSMVFWKVTEDRAGAVTAPPARAVRVTAVALLLGLAVAMTVFAGPLVAFTTATARQLLRPSDYIETVLSTAPGPTDPGEHAGDEQ
jgi:multicomponent K+:H+ antiporter subunit D